MTPLESARTVAQRIRIDPPAVMELYLPIAELSVHWLIILSMGAGVGFLSGVFGVGGGFLLTPLLIFAGIPPGVAVATAASQVSASTFSSVMSHWRSKSLDLKMGVIMLAGGLLGTAAGVRLFEYLRQAGQSEFSVAISYVVLLGSVGSLMLAESIQTIRAVRSGKSVGGRMPGQHNWIHGLPFKLRFRRSRLYISLFPPLILGFVIGVLSAIMGVGGGFIMVPVMIYMLRMPTNVVIGTSAFQVLFVTMSSTLLHAVSNYTVDIMLALILIVGGALGAQAGVRLGAALKGEQLRFLLALLTLAVAAGLLYGLVVTPDDVYNTTVGQG